MLLLGQTTLTSANVASSAVGYLSDECTVLEYVVRSDSRRERALREVKSKITDSKSFYIIFTSVLLLCSSFRSLRE